MPRQKTKEQLQAELKLLQERYEQAAAAEKSAKIKAQAKKRGQMLALMGLAATALIQSYDGYDEQSEIIDLLYSDFVNRYHANEEGLTDAQKNKRQRDQDLLKEALKLAKKGQLR